MQLTQAILPLAGLGTRFLPWTKAVPKELLPIGNRPIVALLVDECLDAGITDICFVISKGKESIPQYFFEDKELEAELARRGKGDLLAELNRYDSVNFHTVYQDEQHGDGHAILQAADWVDSESIAVLFGDDIIIGEKNGLTQLMHVCANQHNANAVLCLEDVPREKTSSYGIADVEETVDRCKVVNGLVEKPVPEEAPSTFGVVGKYILPREVMDVLPDVGASHGGEIRIIDALIAKLNEWGIYGYVFEGTRYDTGTPEGYKKAMLDLG